LFGHRFDDIFVFGLELALEKILDRILELEIF
jgi:hypothetical protein